ncbi:MAG TPA: porin [Terriglobales bacterium]|nr:porin [Terriglobales bacterium]
MQSLKLRRALFAFAALAAFTCSGAVSSWAQSPSTDDLQKKIDDLSQQLAEVKAKLAAMQPAAAVPAQANAIVATPAATPAPTTPTLGSILGPTTLSGFVDAYYGYNSNHPSSLVNGTQPFTPFNNQFGLNMVELVMAKSPTADNRTGYDVALGFGQAMNAVNASEPRAGLGFAQYLKEAYFSYLAPVGKGLQIDVGKFVTPAGAEVIESNGNWNYSRSVLFYYAIPYFHYGARAKYAFNDKVSLTGYLVNGWNNIVDNNSGKTAGFSLAWNPNKKFGITQTFLAGPELAPSPALGSTVDPAGSNKSFRQLWDTVITLSPNAKLTFMINGDYGRGDRYISPITDAITPAVDWYGAAGYVKYAINSKYTLAGRYEYFNDPQGFMTGLGPSVGIGQHWQEGTFTFERDIASHIISRLEYRHDATSQPFFVKGASALSKQQDTASLGLIFSFTTAESH